MLFAVVGVLLASAAAAPSRPPHFVFFLAEYVYTPLRASPHPSQCCQCPLALYGMFFNDFSEIKYKEIMFWNL